MRVDKNRKSKTSSRSKPKKSSETSRPSKNRKSESSKAPEKSKDKSEVVKRKGVDALERDHSDTKSDPAAAREVTKRQADFSAKLTGDSDSPSSFKTLATEDADETTPVVARATAGGPAGSGAEAEEAGPDHLVDDPTETEQRSDLQPPEGLETGAETPDFPDLTGQQPTSSKDLGNGTTRETFESEGVTYTRDTRSDGSVHTSYESEGVDYSNTSYEDGRKSYLISTDRDDGTHTRTVDYNAEGKVTNDHSFSSQAETDPATGEIILQSRSDTVNEAGVRTTSDEVNRPDGGKATTTRTQQPDGTFEEVYDFEGPDSALQRTTTGQVDGPSTTETVRTTTSDQDLEELTNVPGRGESGAPAFPTGDRGDTQVREVEVVNTAADGSQEVQYKETAYSQSSGDVQGEGILPDGVEPNGNDTKSTLTVTSVEARNPETGELESSTAASNKVTVAGQRENGDKVSSTRTDTWNADGSATSYELNGYTRAEQRQNFYFGDKATVGGEELDILPPSVDGKHPDDHLREKGASPGRGGDAIEYLDVDGERGEVVDVNVTVQRDNEGEIKSEAVTWDRKDENGDGKTVSRISDDNGVSWNYENVQNNGNDIARQTVVEGSDLSVVEEYHKTGDGTFTHHQEVKNGDEVSSYRDVSRERVDEAGLDALVTEGTLTAEQRDKLKTDGPPYFVDKVVDHANARVEDGELLKDDDGNIVQGGHHMTSTSVSNDQGYKVSDQFYYDAAARTEESFKGVTDPNGDPPFHGEREKKFYNSSEEVTSTEKEELTVTSGGEIKVGDDKVADLTLADGMTVSELFSAGGIEQLGSDLVGLANEGGTRFLDDLSGSKITTAAGGLEKLGKFADVLGLATGSVGLVTGIRDADARSTIEGIEGIAGGTESLAGALSGLSGRTGQIAGKLSTSAAGIGLAALGGGINIGLGLYDVFTADSGYDQVAGGLTAASGVALAATPFLGPAAPIGAAAAIILGGAGFLVSLGDENNTQPIDDRLG